MKKKNLAFTLAEVLIVIGIIGVVAALTLPNLNHATGDKEAVTRLKKAYSVLNEANDRMVAIYGPISTWRNKCKESFDICYMKKIGEFIKISKSCNEAVDSDSDDYSDCHNTLSKGVIGWGGLVYQLPDGITFTVSGFPNECVNTSKFGLLKDICVSSVDVDINGPKGRNKGGIDGFQFEISDSLGFIPYSDYDSLEELNRDCIYGKGSSCTYWVLEYGNLDYLKADENGKCNDSNIILDGTTNTSCH